MYAGLKSRGAFPKCRRDIDCRPLRRFCALLGEIPYCDLRREECRCKPPAQHPSPSRPPPRRVPAPPRSPPHGPYHINVN